MILKWMLPRYAAAFILQRRELLAEFSVREPTFNERRFKELERKK